MLKRFMPHTLFGRALIIIVAPLILVQIIAAFVFYDRVWDTMTRRLANAIGGEIALVIHTLVQQPDAAARRALFQAVQTTINLRFALREGAALADESSQGASGPVERLLASALAERVRRPFRLDIWTHPREVVIEVQLPDAVLEVHAPRERLFTTTVFVLLFWTVGSSLVLFAVASVFMRNQVRPIRALASAAEEFGKGRDVREFRPSGASEVRQASAAFILMRERLRRFLAQRTEMLAGVSHDLRTPLTRMKLELAMLRPSPSVAGLKKDVADMERMVDSYLAFVRGEGEEQPEPTDLGRLITDVVGQARRDGAAISLVSEGELTLPLRPQAMKRCFDNLIANAARHAAQVDVAVARRGRSIEVTIDDDGPGIPPESREDVFKPFFRLDPSRSPATGGVGLGLTIARDVVRGHGGEVALDTSPRGGLRARVKLPV
jgi:two-component system osmolarity sensor histidine kinase EnvZ